MTSIFTKIAVGETHVYGLSALYDGVESETSVIEYTAPAGNVVTELVPSRENIATYVGYRTSIEIYPEPADAINAEEVLSNLSASAEEPFIKLAERSTGIYDVDGIAEGETNAVFTSGDLSVSVPAVVTARFNNSEEKND
ncbi:hypothetical protein ACIJDO_000097 [Enterococcus hirae]